MQDPSLLFQLECRKQQVESLGSKWYRKLNTINVGRKLDWPVEFKLVVAAMEVNDDEEDEEDDEDEIHFLAHHGDDELDAENTEVDDFVVDCLIQESADDERELEDMLGGTNF